MTAISMGLNEFTSTRILLDAAGKIIWVLLMLSPVAIAIAWAAGWYEILFVSAWVLIIASFCAAVYGVCEELYKRRKVVRGNMSNDD